MIGIQSYGIYIPYHRMSRSDIGKAWGGLQLPGEKAVANFDEDTTTMGVEACRDCLSGFDKTDITSLFLASTTFPYAEKQTSALVAAALDLDRTALTIDVANSLRSGSNAVRLAMNAVEKGNLKSSLVCASDARLGLPNGPKELEFGDGAAALLIGEGDVIAAIDGFYTANNEIFDVYRPAEERFVQFWEDRFIREKGFAKQVFETVSAALEVFNKKPEQFARAVFYSPNPGYLKGVVKKLGFDPKAQATDLLWGAVGNLGSAHSLALLAQALEKAKVGDQILWASYGDGCDVLAVTVTDHIKKVQQKQSVKRNLNSKALTTYQKYLRWRNIVPMEPPKRPRTEPASAVALHRDRKCGLALYGSKCNECGTIQYPVHRICMECQAKDNFEYYSFSEKQGKIATFSHDNLAVSPDPPTTVAAVDFEDGGRIMMDITDRDPSKIKVGMPLEMTFRKFRRTLGVQVYWWKSRPLR